MYATHVNNKLLEVYIALDTLSNTYLLWPQTIINYTSQSTCCIKEGDTGKTTFSKNGSGKAEVRPYCEVLSPLELPPFSTPADISPDDSTRNQACSAHNISDSLSLVLV